MISGPSAKTESPPSTVSPALRRDTIIAFCSARAAAIAPASAPLAMRSCIRAASLRLAGETAKATPAARSMAWRAGLADASTRRLMLAPSRRSVSKFITEAAVSSIERRETSICGQSCCSNSLRVAAISARTVSRSI